MAITFNKIVNALNNQGLHLAYLHKGEMDYSITICSKKVHYCYLFFPEEYLNKADISEKTNPSIFTSIFSGKKDKGRHGSNKKLKRLRNATTGNGIKDISLNVRKSLLYTAIAIEKQSEVIPGFSKEKITDLNALRIFYLNDSLNCEKNIAEQLYCCLLNSGLLKELSRLGLLIPRLDNEIQAVDMVDAISLVLALLIVVALFTTEEEIHNLEAIKREWKIICLRDSNSILFAPFGLMLNERYKAIQKRLNTITNNLCSTLLFYGKYCAWGKYSRDIVPQNSPTCEGLYALALNDFSSRDKFYGSIVDRVKASATSSGICSVSLNCETVIPTATFLVSLKECGEEADYCNLMDKLMEVKSTNGWNVYMEKAKNEVYNLRPTYYALWGLFECNYKVETCFQIIVDLLKRFKTLYGSFIKNGKSCFPLYVNAMTFNLFSFLPKRYKNEVKDVFDPEVVFSAIINQLKDEQYWLEPEILDGSARVKDTSIDNFSWNHVSIRYALEAIGAAVEYFDDRGEWLKIIEDYLARIEDKLSNINGSFFWIPRNVKRSISERGVIVYPTIQLLIGLSLLKRCLRNNFIEFEQT